MQGIDKRDILPLRQTKFEGARQVPNNRPTADVDPVAVIDALSGITEGLGNWVAGPIPDNPIAARIQQRYRDVCDDLSNAPPWLQPIGAPARTNIGNLCDPWLAANGSSGPTASPPFTGGQCPVIYRLQASDEGGLNVFGNPVPPSPWYDTPRTALGPIRGVSVEQGPLIMLPDFYRWNIRLTDVNGVQSIWQVGDNNTGFKGVKARVRREDGLADNCGDPQPVPTPSPNPRPRPGLGSEDEPFIDPKGRPVIPMPPIDDPLGGPVQLANFPLPPLFAEPSGDSPANPNVGPPVEPGEPQPGNGSNGGDDDFPPPPEGSIWVGFIVQLSDQGLTEGLQANSPPHPVFRSTTGNYRAKYNVDGTVTYSTPRPIQSQTVAYFLDLPGLTLTGARVNVPSNDSYVVIPLSQPEKQQEPQQV